MKQNLSLYDRISTISYDAIKEVYQRKGYKFYIGEYSINIFGIRSNNRKAGMYDDVLGYAIITNGKPEIFIAQGTTDPGIPYLENPQSTKGCAILVAGQYRGAYTVGWHGNNNPNFRHKALIQCAPMKVYRDNDKDEILDFDAATIQEGIFGINIHRGSKALTSSEIGKYSAGCQVFKSAAVFEDFMKVVEKSAGMYGNKFTYTLFNEDDISA